VVSVIMLAWNTRHCLIMEDFFVIFINSEGLFREVLLYLVFTMTAAFNLFD